MLKGCMIIEKTEIDLKAVNQENAFREDLIKLFRTHPLDKIESAIHKLKSFRVT